MTFNEELIREHLELYKKKFKGQLNLGHGEWFSYLKWLSSWTAASNFTVPQCKLVAELLGEEF